MSYILAFDIGGTKIAVGIFDSSANEELERIVEPMPQTSYEDFLSVLDKIIEQLKAEYPNVIKVGAGFCGAYDKKHDVITSAGNVPFCAGKNFRKDLKDVLQKRGTECPVFVDNDANCAALAEALEGSGKDYDSVFLMILGTGVGGGLVINKQLVSGSNGLTGELARVSFPIFDEMDLELANRLFAEKRRQHFETNANIEQFISGKSLKWLYELRAGKVKEAHEISDPKVIDEYFELVSKAVSVIVNLIDPEAIVLSGGISSLSGICEEVQQRMTKYTIVENPNTKILPAKFGATAGLKGAAMLTL